MNKPPEGDWLGTQFLRFERHGPLAHVIVDRPEARNALTPAMYFGIRYAVDHVNRDADLAGLLITGTGDVFMPGGDLGGANEDGWADLPTLLGMDNTPFDAVRRSVKPVVTAVNGLAQGGGLMISLLSDVAVASDRATFRGPRAAPGHRRHQLRAGAAPPDRPGPRPRHADDRAGRHRGGGGGVGAGGPGGAPRAAARRGRPPRSRRAAAPRRRPAST